MKNFLVVSRNFSSQERVLSFGASIKIGQPR
jgi:hypothetical protein